MWRPGGVKINGIVIGFTRTIGMALTQRTRATGPTAA